MTKLTLADTTLRLEDRLADIAFGKRICQPLLYLYCAGYDDSGRYGGFFLTSSLKNINFVIVDKQYFVSLHTIILGYVKGF